MPHLFPNTEYRIDVMTFEKSSDKLLYFCHYLQISIWQLTALIIY